jgi:hypothetical protein
MSARNVLPPRWVHQALERASRNGIVQKPAASWTNAEIQSFLRTDERCWLIADDFYFDGHRMICEPLLAMDRDDPRVITSCQSLAEILDANYRADPIDRPGEEMFLRIEFSSRSV